MRRGAEELSPRPFISKMVVPTRRANLDIRSKLQAPRTTDYRLIHLSPILLVKLTQGKPLHNPSVDRLGAMTASSSASSSLFRGVSGLGSYPSK